jgi:phosphoribosyl 1,2-cyclic phosphodiesterase
VLATSGRHAILVDNGLSYKQLQLRCAEAGVPLDTIRAIFVTHEHGDHVLGLGTAARKLRVPVFMTEACHASLPKKVGALPGLEIFEAGETLQVAGFELSSYSVSHDAADPVGYVVQSAGLKLGLAADMGHISALVKARLAGAHALVLESNYCPDMLTRSAYPPQVRQRINGRQGHLSNADMSALLASLLHEKLQVVVLVHLSEENNTPGLALEYARRVMNGHRAQLHVASQDRPTPLFELTP